MNALPAFMVGFAVGQRIAATNSNGNFSWLPKLPPFATFHAHSLRRTLAIPLERTLFVGRDSIVFGISERTGNIWMAEWKEQRIVKY